MGGRPAVEKQSCCGGKPDLPSPCLGSVGLAARQGGVRHRRGAGGHGGVRENLRLPRSWGLGGQWGHAPRCLSTSVRSEVLGAERLQAASDLVVLCMQSQKVCGRESVEVHGGHSACAQNEWFSPGLKLTLRESCARQFLRRYEVQLVCESFWRRVWDQGVHAVF